MDSNNLLSGLAGAVIALIVTEFWKFVAKENDLVEEREIFKNYLEISMHDVFLKYALDIDKASNRIANYPSFDMINDSDIYDANPILNSSVFKEIGFNRLFLLLRTPKLHNDAIDLYNVIEYLIADRPLTILQSFIIKYDDVIKDRNATNAEVVSTKLSNLKYSFQENLKHKKVAINQAIEINKRLIDSL